MSNKYKILGTEIDDGKLLIKIKNYHDHTTLLYYIDEIEHIPNLSLKEFLMKRKPFLENYK